MAVMYHFCYSCLWLVLLTRTWISFVLYETFLGNRFELFHGNVALLLPLMVLACRQHETLVLRLFITIMSRGWHCHHEPWQHESILLHYVERGDLSLPLSRTSLVSTSQCTMGFALKDLAQIKRFGQTDDCFGFRFVFVELFQIRYLGFPVLSVSLFSLSNIWSFPILNLQ